MRSSQGMKWKLKQKHSHHVGEDERKVSNIFICLEVFGKNVHVCWKLRHQSFCVAGINARILVTNSSFNHKLSNLLTTYLHIINESRILWTFSGKSFHMKHCEPAGWQCQCTCLRSFIKKVRSPTPTSETRRRFYFKWIKFLFYFLFK